MSFLSRWFGRRAQKSTTYSRKMKLLLERLELRDVPAVIAMGPEFLVNSTTSNNQFPSASGRSVAADSEGNFVAAWTSELQDGSGQGVYARQFDALGQPLGGEFLVNTTTANNQGSPSVSVDPDGNFVVVWQDDAQDGSGSGIFGQRYNSLGVAQGGEFQVNSSNTGNQTFPTVALDGAGNFIVSWQSADASGEGIFARQFDAAGVALGAQFQVNDVTAGDQIAPYVAASENGNFVIAWTSDGEDGDSYGIRAQAYDSTGATIGSVIAVNTYTTGEQSLPSVAMNATGGFGIAWMSFAQDGSDYGVFAQLFDSLGGTIGSEIAVNSTTTNGQSSPSIAMDDAGEFAVAWQSNLQDGDEFGVYVRRYDAAGTPITGEMLVNTTTTGSQTSPSAAMSAHGDFVVLWQGADAAPDGVYAQIFQDTPTKPIDNDGAANSVNEGASIGSLVGITALSVDPDAATITYSLTSDAGGRFAINPSTGIVTVANGSLLNFEDAASHNIVVQSTGVTVSSLATFSISVANVAPLGLTDIDGAIGGSIAEGASVGSVVGIEADATEPNGPVIYSLTDSAGGRFAINSVTGVVTVNDSSSLDFETNMVHSITVQASDGLLTTSATFSIAVTDVGPTLASDANTLGDSISEGASVGSLVGITAVATDVNGPATLTYTLTDDAGGLFAIDSISGVVTVASQLDYETSTVHSIEVQSSAGSLFSLTSFTILVTDVAPTTPIDLAAAPDVIAEGASVGSLVGIQASSTDPGGPATLTYMLTNDAGGRFAIDPSTGLVTVANSGSLDYESSTVHSIVVEASSGGVLTSSETFTILVSDVAPTAPTDLNGTANSILEGATNGSLVQITANATDVNGPATLNYSLSDDAGGRFAINSSTGEVTVANGSLINYESATVHSIAVTASAGISSTTTTMAINVVNVAPSTPIDSNSLANSVAENAAPGTAVGLTAASTDPSSGSGDLTYSLTDNSSNRFQINPTTGDVSVGTGTLDFETATSHTIVVQTTDGNLTSSLETFTINVTNSNPTTPIDVNPAVNQVVQGPANGTPVGITAQATDAGGTTVTYSLTSNPLGRFNINSSTGVVTTANTALLNSVGSHSITVQASDGALTSSQTFTINVIASPSGDNIAPVGKALPVFSDVAGTVGTLQVMFSEAVNGVDLSDFTLFRDGVSIDLSAAGATVSTGNNITFSLNGLTSTLAVPGTYTLTVNAAGSGIVDSNNNLLNSNVVNTWQQFDQSNGVFTSPSWTAQSGSFQVQSLALVANTNAPVNVANILTLNTVPSSDMVIEGRVTVSATTKYAGLTARNQGAGENYGYLLDLDNWNNAFTKVTIFRRSGGSNITLATTNIAKISDALLRFEVIGNNLRAYVNNTLLLTASDSTFASGLAGVRGGFGSTFKEVNISTLNGVNATLPFTDNFTNAYGTTNRLGAAWTDRVGVVQVNSGVVQPTNTLSLATVNGTTAVTNASVEANITVSNTGSTSNYSHGGLVARHSGVGDNNLYVGNVFGNGTTFTAGIHKIINGVTTTLASVVVGTGTSFTANLRFQVEGTSLKLYQNGVLILQATNAELVSGSVGLRGGSLIASTKPVFDNFAVNAVAYTPVTLPYSDPFSQPVNSKVANTWREVVGSFAPTGTVAQGAASFNDNLMKLEGVSAGNVSVTATVTTASGTGNLLAGVVAHVSTSGTSYYFGGINRNGATYTAQIFKVVNGVKTVLSTVALPGAPTTGTVQLNITGGTNLQLLVDSNLAGTAIDGTVAAGSVGVFVNKNGTVDNFSAS